MTSLKITDIKSTMAKLLLKEDFDELYLEKAEVKTFAMLSVNGKRNMNWYDDDEKEAGLSALLKWKEMKHIFFEYIKGKKTPELFRIVLKADENMAKHMLAESGVYGQYVSSGADLFLRVLYEKEILTIVTGISQKEFSLDKSLEFAWDDAVKRWLKEKNLSFEQE